MASNEDREHLKRMLGDVKAAEFHPRSRQYVSRASFTPPAITSSKPDPNLSPQDYLVQEVVKFAKKRFPKISEATISDLEDFVRDVSTAPLIRTGEENRAEIKEKSGTKELTHEELNLRAQELKRQQHAAQGAAWRRQIEKANRIATDLAAIPISSPPTDEVQEARINFFADMLMQIPKILDTSRVGMLQYDLSALHDKITNGEERLEIYFGSEGNLEPKKGRRGL